MTMVVGYNLGSHAVVGADTRVEPLPWALRQRDVSG